MRDPALRAKLLAEVDAAIAPMRQFLDPERAFPIGDAPDYEPTPRATASRARARAGPRRSMDVYYDVLIDDDGLALVLRPLLNYTELLTSTRCARCCCTRRARGDSATAARTAARRATRARRRSCSRTGRATATTTGCRSSGS